MAQQLESSGGVLLGRTLKLAGEAVVPGASLLLEGKVGPGAVHLILGAIATMAVGPLGRLLVAANSYSTSVSGQGLLSSLATGLNNAAQATAAAVNPAPAVDTPKK
jgi:hypothetical protein